MSANVIVREVGLRDGLQLVKSFVPTETKIKWLKAVAAAGVPEVEVTNFVPAKVIPQFADATEVAKASLDIPGPRMCALAPNRKGDSLNLGYAWDELGRDGLPLAIALGVVGVGYIAYMYRSVERQRRTMAGVKTVLG